MINNKSTSIRQQCKWISSLFQVVSRLKYIIKYSQVVSRLTYNWYPTNGTHEDSKCPRNGFIDKSIIHVVSHFYTWYQSYKTVVPQVILNFKWSSSEESSLTYKSSSLSSEWPMLWHRGRCPTNWYQGQRSYMSDLKGYGGVIPTYGSVHQKGKFKCQPSTLMQSFASMRSTTFM